MNPSSGRYRQLPALVVSALCLVPLVFMVSGSLRRAGTPPPRTPELVPPSPTLDNYSQAFDLVDLGPMMANSAIVALFAVPLTLLVASWAGFAMTRLTSRWAGYWTGASLIALMVPSTALLVSRFAIFRALDLTNTLVPLVAPGLLGTSPFYVLFFYWSSRQVPAELIDAARIEGAGTFTIWRRVVLPLVRPTTFAVAVLSFVYVWGNFIDPLIYLSDPDLATLPLGLKLLSSLDRTNAPVFLAGAVAATLPVVVALVVAQRYFLSDSKGSALAAR